MINIAALDYRNYYPDSIHCVIIVKVKYVANSQNEMLKLNQVVNNASGHTHYDISLKVVNNYIII